MNRPWLEYREHNTRVCALHGSSVSIALLHLMLSVFFFLVFLLLLFLNQAARVEEERQESVRQMVLEAQVRKQGGKFFDRRDAHHIRWHRELVKREFRLSRLSKYILRGGRIGPSSERIHVLNRARVEGARYFIKPRLLCVRAGGMCPPCTPVPSSPRPSWWGAQVSNYL